MNESKPSRLSFDKKLAVHRSNRLNNTFGQINIPYECQSKIDKETDDATLLPLQYKVPTSKN